MEDSDSPPSGRGLADPDGIRPGAAVWAKLSRYPWWPSMVLGRDDERIPAAERSSTRSSTPVLFFGTADFAWIDAARNVSPWAVDNSTRRSRDRSTDFKRALIEADEYEESGELPQSFEEDAFQDEDDAPAPAPAAQHAHHPDGTHLGPGAAYAPASAAQYAPPGVARAAAGAGAPGGAGAPAPPYPLLRPEEAAQDARHVRRLTVQRRLGLCPPIGSPAAIQAVANPNLGPLIQQAMMLEQIAAQSHPVHG